MITRFFYGENISDFKKRSPEEILGIMAQNNDFDLNDLQRNAWVSEISILKNILEDREKGIIALEYSIPRMGKRVDAILLMAGIVYVLEFKVGEKEYLVSNRDQVWDYALDLKNFHQDSHDRYIVPILIATEAPYFEKHSSISVYDDKVLEPQYANKNNLKQIILNTEQYLHYGNPNDDMSGWLFSRYNPTPTIIEAARALYDNNKVEDIAKTEASAKNLHDTVAALSEIVDWTKKNNKKSICFVTGVPGAGKTLVGLDIATNNIDIDRAVYLSGNYPLVKVLTEALARDRRDRSKCTLSEARRMVHSFIQIIHHYRNTALENAIVVDGEVKINEDKVKYNKEDGYAQVEHIAIFDEAQRAWTQQQLSSWLSRKKGIQAFPYSEPEFLIWSMDQRQDWAVIICLVGGGQEINTGEAGISEWLRALNYRFSNWEIFISDQITSSEYSDENLTDTLNGLNQSRIHSEPNLHLAVSMRSFRAEKLSLFVNQLLSINPEAKKTLEEVRDKYPILLTRDLSLAKRWLRKKARGTERYGMLVSSGAYRLKPLAIDVRVNPDVVHWFLDDINDIRSSVFLEDAATEFDVQGLEVDWACVLWDGDMRFDSKNKTWSHYSFNGQKWLNINKKENRTYQLNAYRVLLTRARQGMIIVVPEGNSEDPTRKPEFYDETYLYFKSLGIDELNI